MNLSRSLVECVAQVPRGSSVVIPPTCATPAGLDEALAMESDRLAGSRLWSGLLFGSPAFTDEPHVERLRYGTWHLSRSTSDLAAAGYVDFYPVRASHVNRFLQRRDAAEVVVVQVSPPDAEGYCSLGVSGSYLRAASAAARLLIAQVNHKMPRVPGPARIRLSDATFTVTDEQELVEYSSTATDDVSRRIAALIEPMIADGATLQIGLGGIPEALLEALKDTGRRDLRIWGMATDGVVTADEVGMLRTTGVAVRTQDALGTRRLFDWMDGNHRVELVGYEQAVSVHEISRVPDFIAVNSALEVDLYGNCNAEVLGGRQISGIGGAVDLAEGARLSPGGASILALPSTARSGQVSRIVPRLAGVPHTVPRTTVQYVVTEFGLVDLSVLSLDQRADALIELAAPEFRDWLGDEHDRSRRGRRQAAEGEPPERP